MTKQRFTTPEQTQSGRAERTHSSRLAESPLVFPGLPLLAGVIAVSFSAIFIKLCLVPAAAIGMYRLLLTVLLLTPFVFLQQTQRRAIATLTLRDGMAVMLSGLLLGLHFLFWISSLKHTSVASSMLITTLQPVFVGIATFFTFSERMSRRRVLALAVALIGTVIIALGDDARTSSTFGGDLLSLAGTLAIGGYMLVGQEIRARLPSTAYNWAVFFVAGLALLVDALITGTPLAGYRSSDWLLLVLLALIPTLFGHALFNWLLRYVSATTISVTILGEPIGAIILAWWWLLAEPLHNYQILGGLVIVMSVAAYLYKTPVSTPPSAQSKGSQPAGE